MFDLILTQNSTFIIGQVAWVLGKLMNGIVFVLDKIAGLYGGTANLGIAIIVFTVIIYLLINEENSYFYHKVISKIFITFKDYTLPLLSVLQSVWP